MMTADKKRVYESTTLGMPALKMVLVHARNQAQNASGRVASPTADATPAEDAPLDKAQAVRRLIEHLKESAE